MKTHITVFEGLGSNYVRDLLIPQLRGPFELDLRRWSDDPKVSALARQRSIIIGHSFGGATAVEAANRYWCDLLVTLDPRIPGIYSLSPFHAFGKLEITRGGISAVNLYQTGPWLPGLLVVGAVNISMNSTHAKIPGNVDVIGLIESWIER